MNRTKTAILILVLGSIALTSAFTLLNLKSDWAVAAFLLIIISLTYITIKTTKRL